MNSRDIKARLERALHKPITPAEWLNLQHRGLVDEYSRNPLAYTDEENWREFRDSARRELDFLRQYREDSTQEQAGDLEDVYLDHSVGYQIDDSPADPEDRASARRYALGALNALRASETAPSRAAVDSMLLPRGGVDGTLPQWVNIMAVELWVPAEEVAEKHRRKQQAMMTEPDPPKTRARAFNVARFVWELERHYGERPPWPVMCERWNNFPLTRPFERWRDFRTNFLRGAKATPPRYVASNEQLTEQVRVQAREQAGLFHYWAGKVLAATVQQPE